MVETAKRELRYKAALHPILFELLPEKFTIPQLQYLYEGIYGATFDKRNFSRKLLSTGLLTQYKEKFQAFLNFIPNHESLIFKIADNIIVYLKKLGLGFSKFLFL